MPASVVFMVRVKKDERYWLGRSVRTKAPFGMEGIFATREQALAFQAEQEKIAAESGDPAPLLDLEVDGLYKLSAFEPEVFRDWLIDHEIPDPQTFASDWTETGPTFLLDWLYSLTRQQMTDLYTALHHFRFYEVIEVPLVYGEYYQEQWEQWEKELPPASTLQPEDAGFRDDGEGGFSAEAFGGPPDWLATDTAEYPDQPVGPSSDPPAWDDIPF
jgi:hypothetical protein